MKEYVLLQSSGISKLNYLYCIYYYLRYYYTKSLTTLDSISVKALWMHRYGLFVWCVRHVISKHCGPCVEETVRRLIQLSDLTHNTEHTTPERTRTRQNTPSRQHSRTLIRQYKQ